MSMHLLPPASASVTTVVPPRRRVLHAAGALLAALLLPACASGGPRAFDWPQARLEELLARQFPLTRSFGGLVELTLQSPRLRLLPERNRLGTAFELLARERLTGAHASGGLDLEYGLRFEAHDGSVRMTDVRVNRLTVDRLSPAQQALLAQYAPRLAGQLLEDRVLYRVPPERLASARQLGLGVSALRVLPDGLRLELAPLAPR